MASEASKEDYEPTKLRMKFRSGELYLHPTSGICRNYVQANVAIVSTEYAADFKKFVDLNAAPCPLLYMSDVGEYQAPPLAKDSDIRTDLAAYKVYQYDTLDHTSADLKQYNWDKYVTFYLGCSFTFEERLLSAGIPVRNISQGMNVSMYQTNIDCESVGPFACKMVVSMRPIPRDLLHATVKEVLQMDFAHGAPVHIGNPGYIGIEDMTAVIGDSVKFEDNDVPVFWACGVTSSHAITSARMPISFSHSPGCMFVTDKTVDDMQLLEKRNYPEANVICIDEKEQIFSVISADNLKRIMQLEQIALDDPGNRGVKELLLCNDLLHASLSISQSVKSVAIITGFPCMPEVKPPFENDGLAGAVCLAKAIQSLGKPVTFIVDQRDVCLFKQIVSHCHQVGLLTHEVSVICMAPSAKTILVDELTDQTRFSHLISIERPGRTSSGVYSTMNKVDVSLLCDPIDSLFIEASKLPGVVTIGIGDGGNEIGMGKVFDKVAKFIKHGDQIGTVISTDYLITAGVSNWGGYALAKAIYLCASCPVQDRYTRKGIGSPRVFHPEDFVADVKKEEALLEYLLSVGIRDGITRELSKSVDGMDFYPIHADKITQLSLC